jgi:hypothetical protein
VKLKGSFSGWRLKLLLARRGSARPIAKRSPVEGRVSPLARLLDPFWQLGLKYALGAEFAAVGMVLHTDLGIIDVKAYKAKGDGTTDDTAAIQAALNVYSSQNLSGSIYFPPGSYKITSALTYHGGNSYGLRIQGAEGTDRGPNGSVLRWYGAADVGGVLQLLGANGCVVENLQIDGAAGGASTAAKYGLLLSYDASNGNLGASGNILRNLGIGGCGRSGGPAGSACIALGNAGGNQTDANVIDGCVLVGYSTPGTTEAGIIVLGAGNTKDFRIHGGSVTYCQYAVEAVSLSGYLSCEGMQLANNTVADFRAGAGCITLTAIESEGSVMFLKGTTGANHASAIITGCSWTGTCAADDIMINHSGALILSGNYFANTRTGASVPKVTVGTGSTNNHTLISEGNFYQNATDSAPPFFDASVNNIKGGAGTAYANATGSFYLSGHALGDLGGTSGALVALSPFIWGPLTHAGVLTFLTSPLLPVAAQGGNYTLTATDFYEEFDATVGAMTATLPAATAAIVGRAYEIIKVDSSANAVNVAPNGTDTINGVTGATAYQLTVQWEFVKVRCTAAGKWRVVA